MNNILGFLIFLLIYFLVYGGMHYYFLHKFNKIYSLLSISKAVFILFLVFMILCPIIIRFLESLKAERIALFFSYLGYIWMGLLFIFCSTSLVFDLYHLLISFVAIISKQSLLLPGISTNIRFIIPIILAVIVNIYGYYEANSPKVEHVVIKSSKISKDINPLRIVQISDLHLGLIVREKKLSELLLKIKELNPDILISTGDLLDGQGDNTDPLIRHFRSINPKYGKYAVLGNHEFYVGLKHAIEFTKESGFNILRGKVVEIPDVLNIAGLDDPTAKSFTQIQNREEADILKDVSKDRFTLLLKHSPYIDQKSLGLFDLQLSGHTHNGQIFPFNLLVKLFFPYIQGLTELSKGSLLYISRGSGTWGPPIRFLAPPEITLIEVTYNHCY